MKTSREIVIDILMKHGFKLTLEDGTYSKATLLEAFPEYTDFILQISEEINRKDS